MMGEGEEGMEGRKDERSEGGKGEGGKGEGRKDLMVTGLEPHGGGHVTCLGYESLFCWRDVWVGW